MSKISFGEAVTFAVIVGVPLGVLHHNGNWASSRFDKGVLEQLRIGKLSCGMLHPLQEPLSPAVLKHSLDGCKPDQWCIDSPRFQDNSTKENTQYKICANGRTANVTVGPDGKVKVLMALTGYSVEAQAVGTKTGSATQVLSVGKQLPDEKLYSALSGNEEACSLYIEGRPGVKGLSETVQHDLNNIFPNGASVAMRVKIGSNASCDQPGSEFPSRGAPE
jgi:hypothetical protein